MSPDEPLAPEALFDAAVEHHRARRLDQAEQLYGAVLAAQPGHVRASHNLGALLLQRKDLERALPLLALAAQADPDGPQSWITYAHGLIVAGRFDAAQALLGRHAARAADPPVQALEIRLRQAWGLALLDSDDLAAAKLQFARVLEIAPELAEAHADMGLVRLRLGDAAGAEADLLQALAISPDDLGALTNLASARSVLGRHAEAEAGYRDVLARDAGYLPATRSLGVLLSDVGRYDEALALLEDVIARQPADDPEARYRRSTLRLLLCDFAAGWRDWETRWQNEAFLEASAGVVTPALRALLKPDVEAAALAGRRVLLVAEQGIGDQVMFASMIPDLAALAGAVTCVCDARLVALFEQSFPGVAFVGPRDARIGSGAFDVVLAMGSLGRLFRNRLEDFPARPYLRPRAALVDAWRDRLGPLPAAGLRIGVSWRGGTPGTRTADRSIAIDDLRPVLRLPDSDFVNLQYGDVVDEVEAANAVMDTPIRLFPRADLDDFEELAALLLALDVVVSVQTSVVHLSGAVGAPCLALIPRKPEWRYTAEQATMPWYASVRLFRRREGEDWNPAIERLTQALRDRNPPLASRQSKDS